VEPADVSITAFAMPLTSPSFAGGPYRYTNREYLIVTYRTSRAALEEAVPEPLTFDEPPVRCEYTGMLGEPNFLLKIIPPRTKGN
jgi:acetoacetate decarboxylase